MEKTEQKFKYFDFTKDKDKYLEEIKPPKVTIISSVSENTVTSFTQYRGRKLTTKLSKFTLDDYQIIDALRALKKQFYPNYKGSDIKSIIEKKANWGDPEEINSHKVRTYISRFQGKFRHYQQKLLDEAFGA